MEVDATPKEQFDDATIKKLISLSSSYDLYVLLILGPYQEATQHHYTDERLRCLLAFPPAQYFAHAAKRVKEEVERLEAYCGDRNKGTVLITVDWELIRPQADIYEFVRKGK